MLQHSFPKFPDVFSDGYSGVPDGELVYGQSVLCVSTDLTGLNVIGLQLQLNYMNIFDYNAPDYTPVRDFLDTDCLIATRARTYLYFARFLCQTDTPPRR